jgi:hypothetical protein
MRRGAIAVGIVSMMIVLVFAIVKVNINADTLPGDDDGDGRPDEFEIEYDLDTDPISGNDIEWTFLIYVCADDEDSLPSANCGSLLFEAWQFIEKLSWVGCTDNITFLVQFDGSDQLNGNHSDMRWDRIPNNFQNNINPTPTTTRRFLIGHDSIKNWIPRTTFQSIYLDTITSLWDVTDWPSGDPRTHGTNWEANMADPNTLYEFIDWGLDTFPSDNYGLYVLSHGGGLEGFGVDYRPNTGPTGSTMDVLTLSEIQSLASMLANEEPPKKLDVTIMYSCYMGILDFCMEFSEFTDYYIGSENIMHTNGNQDDVVFGNLDGNPNWSVPRFCQEYIDVLWNYTRDNVSISPFNVADWDSSLGLTCSTMNCSYLRNSNLINEMTTMNQLLLYGITIDPYWYKNVLSVAAEVYSTDWYRDNWILYEPRPINMSLFSYTQIDYYHFIQAFINVSAYPGDGIYVQLLNAAMNISDILWNNDRDGRGIEYERHDENYCNFTRTQGIAIYCPPTMPYLNTPYNYGNSKVGSTYWEDVVFMILNIRDEQGGP